MEPEGTMPTGGTQVLPSCGTYEPRQQQARCDSPKGAIMACSNNGMHSRAVTSISLTGHQNYSTSRRLCLVLETNQLPRDRETMNLGGKPATTNLLPQHNP